MDLIGQELASWDLQQSPVREEEGTGEGVGVQKGLLEPPPLSQGCPLLHTHTALPSLQGEEEGGGGGAEGRRGGGEARGG